MPSRCCWAGGPSIRKGAQRGPPGPLLRLPARLAGDGPSPEEGISRAAAWGLDPAFIQGACVWYVVCVCVYLCAWCVCECVCLWVV